MTRMPPPARSAVVLSLLSLGCAATASLATLFWAGAFPEPPGPAGLNTALAEARGWSLVTLTVALPLLALSLRAACSGSRAGRLSWLGTLAYLVYTYLELAVSPPFTALYLVYIAAFACAIPALVLGVATADAQGCARALGDGFPRRSIAAFGLASGVLLSLAWLKGIVAQTLAGEFGYPSGIAAIGHVVHALDLGLQAPLGIATAALLLRKRPGGVVLAAIFLVNSLCMGLALTAMVAVSSLAAGQSGWAAAPFALMPLLSASLAFSFFRALEEPRRPHGGPPRPLRLAEVPVSRGRSR